MDVDALVDDLDDLEELEALQDLEQQRRLLQDRMDPFRMYSNEDFLKRYRLSKEAVLSLAQRLEPRIMRVQNIRGKGKNSGLSSLCMYLVLI